MAGAASENRGNGAWRIAGAGGARHIVLPLLEGIPGLAHAFTVRDSDPAVVVHSGAGRPLPIVTLRQVHGRVVRWVDGTREGTAGPQPEGDALLTSGRGLALAVQVADCVPILLCDPVRRRIGAVHAGWRGTVAGVLRAALEELHRDGSAPADLRVGIGPSIGPCCFEVGPEVVEAFRAADTGAERSIRPGPRPRIDLVDANRRQALAAGISSDAIAVAGLCTACRPDLLESYRRSRGAQGRMAALIAWRD